MLDEETIQNQLKLEVVKMGGLALRNNSGVLKDANGNPVRFGLGNTSEKINRIRKSSDLICPITITVTPDMVGHKIAIFVPIECKRQGWKWKGTQTEIGQFNFIKKLQDMGAPACFAQSVEDFHICMREWYGRFKKNA